MVAQWLWEAQTRRAREGGDESSDFGAPSVCCCRCFVCLRSLSPLSLCSAAPLVLRVRASDRGEERSRRHRGGGSSGAGGNQLAVAITFVGE